MTLFAAKKITALIEALSGHLTEEVVDRLALVGNSCV
jgi:hypothetical protein